MSTVAIASIAAAGIGAAGSIAAGSEQAGAAKSAAQLQAQEAQQSLAFQEKEFDTQQQNLQPWLQAGEGALSQLTQGISPGTAAGPTTAETIGGQNYDLQTGGTGNLLTPWSSQFQAPTAASAQQTPGYAFTLGQGEQALQNSAAASGGLLTGGTAKGITNYAEGLASTTYQQTYNNALTQYQQAYNQFQQNQSNTYNRLAGVAQTGQTAANTLGAEGQQAAQNVSNINLTTGQLQGQQINNAAAATASGYVGAANAAGGALSGLAGSLTLQQLLAGGGASATGGGGGYTYANPTPGSGFDVNGNPITY